jgi:multidrug efflux system outer membrane protein
MDINMRTFFRRVPLRGSTLAGLTVLALSACGSLAPDYQRPDAPVPAGWPNGPAYTHNAKPVEAAPDTAKPDWRAFISEPKLQRVIELALTNNRDLRSAALAIEKAQAQYQIQGAALFPHIGINAADTAALTPADLSLTGSRMVAHEYSVGLGFSAYELDLFGRIRNLKEQALQQYLGTEEAQRSAQISLIAQTASAWLNLAADKQHLFLAERMMKNQQSAYLLQKRRFDVGTMTAVEFSQIQAAVDLAHGEVARYDAIVAQDLNALTLLAGTGIADELLPTPLTEPNAVRDINGGLPSSLLQNRPDILQAEHQLRAANADIGVARAAFFPSITLTSSFGTASAELGGLFKTGSRTWLFAPQLNLPIFDGGANNANLKAAQADRAIAVAQYEKSIQSAFREVADALADHGTLAQQVAAQQSQVTSATLNYDMSTARLKQGIDSYLTVLDAQRTQFTAQHNLASATLAQATNRINLYKALGGVAVVKEQKAAAR